MVQQMPIKASGHLVPSPGQAPHQRHQGQRPSGARGRKVQLSQRLAMTPGGWGGRCSPISVWMCKYVALLY
jgi:hypothetical protein